MIRISLLYCFVVGTGFLAFRDWYRSLCGLILLMVVLQHPDMPKTVLGIPGLNPWNLLLLMVLVAWALNRRREGLRWDMPPSITLAWTAYMSVLVIAFVRMMADRGNLEGFTTADLITEDFVNVFKWVIPGILLFDGCRSRRRFVEGLAAVLGLYFLLSLLVIKAMPLSGLTGEELSARSAKLLQNQVGYNRVNMSMMLAGGSWAIFAARDLARSRGMSLCITGAAMVVAFGQALTGGRTGYVTWFLVGLVVCSLRWRRFLLLVPVVVFVVGLLVPSARDRLLQGLPGQYRDSGRADEAVGEDEIDQYTVTSGRSLIWPYVIEKIGESPHVGYGKLAMQRTGLVARLAEELHEDFPHPHNAYLQMLLDNGWIGLAFVLPFFLIVLVRTGRLLLDSREAVFGAAGGAAAALILALMFAAVGSQTFYPREGSVGMWCAIGLGLRISVERSKALARAHLATVPRPTRRPAPLPETRDRLVGSPVHRFPGVRRG